MKEIKLIVEALLEKEKFGELCPETKEKLKLLIKNQNI